MLKKFYSRLLKSTVFQYQISYLLSICLLLGPITCHAQQVLANSSEQTQAHHPWRQAILESSWQFEIKSSATGLSYLIWVYLPQSAAPARGYPVLWALDGNASFPALRSAHLTQLSRASANYQDGVIIAIGHPGLAPFAERARSLDYTPYQRCANCPPSDLVYGGAAEFRHFISDELRPLIAAKIPLDLQRQTLFGFSYGGLFSVDTLLNAPQLFQRYWITSPSLWFNQHQLLQQAPNLIALYGDKAQKLRVFLSTGTDEEFPRAVSDTARLEKLSSRKMLSNTQSLAKLLRQQAGIQVSEAYPADHDHGEMFDFACRRVSAFAFSN